MKEQNYVLNNVNWDSITKPKCFKIELATMDDLSMVEALSFEFYLDVFGERCEASLIRDRALSYVDSSLKSYRRMFLLRINDECVACCAVTCDVGGVARLGFVLTPRAHRRRGYASFATAHVAQLLLNEAKRVTLLADIANPTSNSIYQKIGFQPTNQMIYYKING
jgi:predicted GNAT family acetyltransferase